MKLNLFKPKAAKTDYVQSMLPQNRKEVFFDVLKLHWQELLRLGVLFLAFSLPLLISQFVQDTLNSSVLQTLTDSSTDEEVLSAYGYIAAMENIRAFFNIILVLIYAVGFSGAVRVIRQYAWEQNVNIRTEFFKGLKQNIKHILLTAFIGGFIYALCVFAFNYASLSTGAISWLLMIPVAISLFIVFPMLCYTVSAISVYSGSWWQNFKIGFAMFAKTPFKTLLAVLCCVAIFIPQCIPNHYCHIFGGIASALLTPFALLGWLLFSFNQFDKYINKDSHPSIVGKGTFANNDNV